MAELSPEEQNCTEHLKQLSLKFNAAEENA
jgi:hypothetical protein